MTAPLPIVEMTEGDLAGVLLTDFPFSMSLDESRRRLEDMIRRAGWNEISPAAIFCAFSFQRISAVWKMPAAARHAACRRAGLRVTVAAPPRRPPKINPEDWSF